MRVRIVRKLADRVDGIDLTNYDVGEVIELPEMDGRLMVAEQWGEFARREADLEYGRNAAARPLDRRKTSSDLYDRLRSKREELEYRDRRHFYRRDSDAPYSHTDHASS
jgi:hypothetical protein